MGGFINWIISILITLPIISVFLLYIVIRIFIDNKRKSILLSIDLSTIFFILSVHFHFITIFEKSFLVFIIIGIGCIMLFFYNVEKKKSKSPSIKKVARSTLRLSFLFFVTCYIILTVCGFTSGLIKNILL
ncbi:hypothetical protein CJ195_07640 [Bacillus sp. UMB0899]|uniref:DUF3397 family protein n=1 Tax=Metabacillus schmidteae TaxID=2730405 RepID=UPI000C7FA21A|nr:hypothetical protein CJ195_07640 [Bacillus sp. UMB0899]